MSARHYRLLVLLTLAGVVAGMGFIALGNLSSEQSSLNRDLSETRRNLMMMRERHSEVNIQTAQQVSLSSLEAKDEVAAETALQSFLLKMASDHGILPRNFGRTAMPVKTEQTSIAFNFEFETGMFRTVRFFEALESQKPAMSLHGIWIRHLPAGTLGTEETPVSVRLTLWTFWSPRQADRPAE